MRQDTPPFRLHCQTSRPWAHRPGTSGFAIVHLWQKWCLRWVWDSNTPVPLAHGRTSLWRGREQILWLVHAFLARETPMKHLWIDEMILHSWLDHWLCASGAKVDLETPLKQFETFPAQCTTDAGRKAYDRALPVFNKFSFILLYNKLAKCLQVYLTIVWRMFNYLYLFN